MPNRFDTDLPRRLMGIWAHPDDEAYLSAGLMGRMVDAGRPVTVLTATRGEKGHRRSGRLRHGPRRGAP
jgi:LmbE family N-acetylglucosaminyl deacetylase